MHISLFRKTVWNCGKVVPRIMKQETLISCLSIGVKPPLAVPERVNCQGRFRFDHYWQERVGRWGIRSSNGNSSCFAVWTTDTKQLGLSCNRCDLYSKRTWFESWLERRFSWPTPLMVFFCHNIFFPWHYSPSGPWPTSMKLSVSLRFFSQSKTVGRTPWAVDQRVARPLPVHKHRKTHTH
jgi:hypothetical protein